MAGSSTSVASASKNPFAGGAAYCASKAGLNAYSEALMQELRHDNIRVSYVLPGSVATGFSGRTTAAGQDWRLHPDDVAEVIVDLLAHRRGVCRAVSRFVRLDHRNEPGPVDVCTGQHHHGALTRIDGPAREDSGGGSRARTLRNEVLLCGKSLDRTGEFQLAHTDDAIDMAANQIERDRVWFEIAGQPIGQRGLVASISLMAPRARLAANAVDAATSTPTTLTPGAAALARDRDSARQPASTERHHDRVEDR